MKVYHGRFALSFCYCSTSSSDLMEKFLRPSLTHADADDTDVPHFRTKSCTIINVAITDYSEWFNVVFFYEPLLQYIRFGYCSLITCLIYNVSFMFIIHNPNKNKICRILN